VSAKNTSIEFLRMSELARKIRNISHKVVADDRLDRLTSIEWASAETHARVRLPSRKHPCQETGPRKFLTGIYLQVCETRARIEIRQRSQTGVADVGRASCCVVKKKIAAAGELKNGCPRNRTNALQTRASVAADLRTLGGWGRPTSHVHSR